LNPTDDEADQDEDDDDADHGTQDSAPVKGVIVADAEATGEDHVAHPCPDEAEEDRDGPR
jgi:hypothetical protein